RRTLATLRRAELGFLGVRVMTCTQTPRRCGHFTSAGDFDFTVTLLRPLRTSWLIVGIDWAVAVPGHSEDKKSTPRCSFISLTLCGRRDIIQERWCGKRNFLLIFRPRRRVAPRGLPALPSFMPSPFQVTHLRRTNDRFPTEWEGLTADGRGI